MVFGTVSYKKDDKVDGTSFSTPVLSECIAGLIQEFQLADDESLPEKVHQLVQFLAVATDVYRDEGMLSRFSP